MCIRDSEGDDEPVSESAEQTFRVEYFYHIVDCTAQSLTKRFEQMALYDTMFGFLHNVEELKTIEKYKLQKKCKDLEVILSFEEQRDISGDEPVSYTHLAEPSLGWCTGAAAPGLAPTRPRARVFFLLSLPIKKFMTASIIFQTKFQVGETIGSDVIVN